MDLHLFIVIYQATTGSCVVSMVIDLKCSYVMSLVRLLLHRMSLESNEGGGHVCIC